MRDENGCTTLMRAIISGRLSNQHTTQTVKLLLEADVDVNAKDKDEYTAVLVYLLVIKCIPPTEIHQAILELLITAGVLVTLRASRVHSVLLYRVVAKGHDYNTHTERIVKLMIDAGADVNAQSPLSVVLERRWRSRCSTLLNYRGIA